VLDPFSGVAIEIPTQKGNRLALEVLEAINSDPMCAPQSDKIRQYIGMEYELLLEKALRAISKYLLYILVLSIACNIL
jgi:hypothetical protein